MEWSALGPEAQAPQELLPPHSRIQDPLTRLLFRSQALRAPEKLKVIMGSCDTQSAWTRLRQVSLVSPLLRSGPGGAGLSAPAGAAASRSPGLPLCAVTAWLRDPLPPRTRSCFRAGVCLLHRSRMGHKTDAWPRFADRAGRPCSLSLLKLANFRRPQPDHTCGLGSGSPTRTAAHEERSPGLGCRDQRAPTRAPRVTLGQSPPPAVLRLPGSPGQASRLL